MKLRIKDGQTILFIGDSITDSLRRTTEAPLGNGYVNLFSSLALVREPEKKITVVNKGIGEDRITNLVSGLQVRWTDDVIANKPDWICILIGINDIHSYLLNLDRAVSPEIFLDAYDDILQRTNKFLPKCKIVLATPFYISNESSDCSFRKKVMDIIPAYIEIVYKMSVKYRTGLVKTHKIFQDLLKYNEADTFCPEPIHPNLTGHLVIAEAIYSALT